MSEMSTHLVGTLVNYRKWSFTDEITKEFKAGTTINVLIAQDAADKSSDYIGHNVFKLTGDTDLFLMLKEQFISQQVVVECRVKVTTKSTKLTPIKVNLVK